MERVGELRGWKRLIAVVAFCAICILVNFIGSQIVRALGLPLHLDCLGIILASVYGGFIPGVVVGYASNLVMGLADPSTMYHYYSLTGILIAVAAYLMGKRGWFEKPSTAIAAIVVFSILGGVVGSAITWFLNGSADGFESVFSALATQMGHDFVIDLVDKTITVVAAVVIIRLLPKNFKKLFDFTFWQQTPLKGEALDAVRGAETQGFSLRAKIAFIVGSIMLIVTIVTISITFATFHHSNIDAQGKIGLGITSLAAESVNPDRVNMYLELGEEAPGFAEAERGLAKIRDSFPDARYIYVYQIREDGCHVVLDPDTADEPGSDPGDVIAFDEAFMPYIDDLLAGRQIDPIVSNETYGWLLTAYQPLYDINGNCVCYVAADLSMEQLMTDEFAFLARVIILFAAFFILVCAIAIWLADYGLVMPINSIAHASANFAVGDESTRAQSLEHLKSLGIRTGDEIENLYGAITKMSEDTVQFIADDQEKAATITRMQDNLIMVMADLVESRDQYTGNHVRKTAAYTRIILEQMRREGFYADLLTDEFVEKVVKAAPLHDIGKIEVSDTILNKTGRLTDDEFVKMQHHTVVGAIILEKAKGAMSEPSYLDEARNLAAYHHEKWNGKGYPHGLAGEEIPLSARVMAVADVFDALVSKRSYKEGMPIEKALSIIREESGSHFDPLVAQAFLDAEDEVRRIAEEHGDAFGTADDIRS